MSRRKIVMLTVVAALESLAQAGGTSARTRTGVKLDTGLVIVPFAVPVAVPVAVVRQPSVLYSYRGYTSPPGNVMAAPVSIPPSDAAAILARHCAACHRGDAAQGQLQMFDETGQLFLKLPRRWIIEAIEAGRMPKPLDAPRLSPAEIDVLREWAQPPRELVY